MGLTTDKIEMTIDEILNRLDVIEEKLNINNLETNEIKQSSKLYDFVSYGDMHGEIMHGQGTVVTKYEIITYKNEQYFKVKVIKNLPNTSYVGLYFLIESTASVGNKLYQLYSIVNDNPKKIKPVDIWVKISNHIE